MTHDVERVFADIDADHGDRCVEFLRHGMLLVLSAPCHLLVLAGPEHGRTIPLAEIRNYCWWKSPNVATRAPRPTSATRLRRKMHNKLLAAARCIRATLFGKIDDLQFPPLRVHILIPKISGVACLAVQHGSGGAFGGYGIMNPRRFPTVAAPLCGTVVLAGWVVASLPGFGSAATETTAT